MGIKCVALYRYMYGYIGLTRDRTVNVWKEIRFGGICFEGFGCVRKGISSGERYDRIFFPRLFQIGEFVKSGLTVFFSTIREMDTIDRITKIEKFCIIILLVINWIFYRRFNLIITKLINVNINEIKRKRKKKKKKDFYLIFHHGISNVNLI